MHQCRLVERQDGGRTRSASARIARGSSGGEGGVKGTFLVPLHLRAAVRALVASPQLVRGARLAEERVAARPQPCAARGRHAHHALAPPRPRPAVGWQRAAQPVQLRQRLPASPCAAAEGECRVRMCAHAHMHTRACAVEHAHLSKGRSPAAICAHAPQGQRPEAPRGLASPRQRGPARQRVRHRLGLARQAGPHARVEVGGTLRGVDGGRAGEELEQDDAEGEDVRRRRVHACRTPRVRSSALPQNLPRLSAPQTVTLHCERWG